MISFIQKATWKKKTRLNRPFQRPSSAFSSAHLLSSINGFDSNKRYNVKFLSDTTIVFANGITFVLLNLETMEKKILFGNDGGGIASIDVTADKSFFAVAEKGRWPNIYVYSSDHRLYRVLRRGAERSYSNICFSLNGEKLASVGGDPDYLICVWNWKQEAIVLKSKAFSQEIYRVSFSQYQDSILTTSGTGHIRFWKIAETFTGLKLKGEIGKFGSFELSDVSAFMIFPDGKVLSGTEYGKMLLWESNFIKCAISVSEKQNCHEGEINAIFKLKSQIVSGSADGTLKFWDYSAIDTAEGDDFYNFFLSPLKVVNLVHEGLPVKVLNVEFREGKSWLLQDGHGKILLFDPLNEQINCVFSANSGKILGLHANEACNGIVSAGEDSYVRFWDISAEAQIYSRQFPGKITCFESFPENLNNKGRLYAVGFSNGIVRFIVLSRENFHLVKAFRVHKNPIQTIKSSPNGLTVAIFSNKNEIFFLSISASSFYDIQPYCLQNIDFAINDSCWDTFGSKILLAGKDGFLREIEVLTKTECDTSKSYLNDFRVLRFFQIKMMDFQKPKQEDLELELIFKRKTAEDQKSEMEWGPAPLVSCCYLDKDCNKALVCAEGKYLGFLYVVDFQSERPILAIRSSTSPYCRMKMTPDFENLFLGNVDGSIEIRHKYDFERFTKLNVHDQDYGRIAGLGLSFNRKSFVTGSWDGTISVHKVDFEGLNKCFQRLGEEITIPEMGAPVILTDFPIESQEEGEEIVNEQMYSIQEEKLLAEADKKKALAEDKKLRVREQIQLLRQAFEKVKKRNSQLEKSISLAENELVVDIDYEDQLLRRVKEEIEETKKEVSWDVAYAELKTKKLKDFFIGELVNEKYELYSIKDISVSVSTFKLKRISHFLHQNLEEIHRMIEEEKASQVLLESHDFTLSPEKKNEKINFDINLEVETDFKPDFEGKTGSKYERERLRYEEEVISKKLKMLETSKPSSVVIEAKYTKEINKFIDGLGDYKLKSDKNFVVPLHMRVNVRKKRKQLYMMEELIFNTKFQFNNELIALYKKKKEIIELINQNNRRIVQINDELGMEEELFWPMALEIDPEALYLVNDSEIDSFEKVMEIKSAKKDSMGMREEIQAIKKSTFTKSASSQEIPKSDRSGGGVFKTRKGIKVQNSELEAEMKARQEIYLKAEKAKLVKMSQEKLNDFETELLKLKREKNILEGDMKLAEMKLITFYQELLILEDMEERDNELIERLLSQKEKKTDLEKKLTSIMNSLLSLEESNERMMKDRIVQAKLFKELVGIEDDSKRDKIYAYYQKKYKKDKAKALKQQLQEDGDEDKFSFLFSDEGEEEGEEEEDDDFLDEDDENKPDIALIDNEPKNKACIMEIVKLDDDMENVIWTYLE